MNTRIPRIIITILFSMMIMLPNQPMQAHNGDKSGASALDLTETQVQVLQVYPNGHNTLIVAQAIYTWSTQFHIDVLPVTIFNACTSVDCMVTVTDPILGTTATHPISYYDVLYFGVADAYGGYDLTTNSAAVVRQFAKQAKGIVFTHDTVARGVNWGWTHPNFVSLTDVHGIVIGDGCSILTYTRVKLISENITDPVINSPFKIPSNYSTLSTHWGCQQATNGTEWYNGTNADLTADYYLYMHTYYNEEYGSNSSFYSYGHTEAAPLEWEAKAMINSMYFSYRGSAPLMELPVDYSYTTFASAALGYPSGRINSWFDHNEPTYFNDNEITKWQGESITYTDCVLGVSCYAGHNGVDFGYHGPGDNIIYAAAPGVVTKTVTGCVVGVRRCGNYYGNQVWIDHGLGYTTLYAHLSTVSVIPGTEITDIATPLGIMGSTGNSTGIHLHFGVYHDNIPVDPYGWFSTSVDPWESATSLYLWKHSLWTQQIIGILGGTIISPSENITAVVPADAVSSLVTFELWDTTPISEPSAQLRTIGRSFWLHILESIENISMERVSPLSIESFTQPVVITVTYSDSDLTHLDENLTTINQWDTDSNSWVSLPTSIDVDQNQAITQVFDVGNFDLQAPLLCPEDSQEPDDSFYAATLLPTDGTEITRLFDIVQDEDWFMLNAVPGGRYNIQTSALAVDVNTGLELYAPDGITLIASNDDDGSGFESQIIWRSPQSGQYFVRVVPSASSSFGCDATYSISVTAIYEQYLPIVTQNP